MEKYFTNGYKVIKDIHGIPINLDSHGRWLCYCNVEKAGSIHEEITLYDNYCERYMVKYDASSKMFVDFHGIAQVSQDTVTLKSKSINQHPLPDFCIDVMQTFSCPIAFETLRRQAEIIAKDYTTKPKGNMQGAAMYYPR